jgi:hypothetical protein
VGLAVSLRLVGVQYGLPDVYNPDEIAIMARALAFAKGSLNPHNFLYPTFYFYVLFAWVGVYLAVVWATGQVESLAALPRLYFTNPTGLYTAGRLLGVLSGSASVLLVHRLAGRLTDGRTAIAAAIFLAVAPLHVRDSHYVKHDVFATLTILVAHLAIVRVWPGATAASPRRTDVLVAGAACGMALSTHYYCVFLLLPLAWAVGQAWRPSGPYAVAVHLAWAVAATGAAFLLLSPFLALEPLTAWRDIVANRQIVVDRAVEGGAFAPARRYLEIIATDSAGWPVVLLGAAGAIWMALVRPAQALLLLAFPLPFLAFVANTVPASRYLNPILPFIAIFAGWTLSSLASRLRTPAAALWVAVALCASPGMAASLRTGLFFRQDDTRTLARRYMEKHIPAGSTVALQAYSVQLTPSRTGLADALTRNVGSLDAASTKSRLQLSLEPYPEPAYRLVFLGRGLDADKIYVDYPEVGRDLDAIRRLGVAFVVVKHYNTDDPAVAAFTAVLAREGRRVAEFLPFRPGTSRSERALIEPFLHNTDTTIVDALIRPGPPLEIWQIDGPGP